MQKKLWLSIVTAMIGVGLLVAAAFAGSASSAPQHKGSAAKVGGTLRVNLSTTDLEYTDPVARVRVHRVAGRVRHRTQAPELEGDEGDAFPEAATAFPRVGEGGRVYTFTIRKGLRLSNGEQVTAANFKFAIQRANNPR